MRNDLRSWSASVVSASSGSINRGTENGWKVTVRLPSDVSPELLTLELSHSSGYAGSSPRSVSVVPDLESSFYIFHMTDEHAKNLDAASDGTHSYGYRSAELISWGAPAVNLANPRFVLNTGDLTYSHSSGDTCSHFGTYGTVNGVDQLGNYLNAKAGYRVASIAVPGNHDIPLVYKEGLAGHDEAAARWETKLGPRSFSVRMGSFYVFAHDYTDEELKAWASTEYGASLGDSSIKFRLVAQHYTDQFAHLPSSANLMLIGHLHNTGNVSGYAYPVIKTIASHEYARAGLLEFQRTSTGWSATNVSGYSETDDVFKLVDIANSNGTPRISATYTSPNDGTATSNRATITNEIGKRFHDGRVRFLMAGGSYTVTGGQKLAEYAYGSGKTAVLVKVDIQPSTTTQVTITRSGIGTSQSFNPVADTFVRGGTYASTNYGASPLMTIKGSPTVDYDREAFLRFDLSGYSASTVSSAKLRVYVNYLELSTALPLKAFGVSDDTWSESGLTWNTRPATGSPLGSVSVTGTGTYTLDVTSFVSSAISGDKKVSFVLKDDTGANNAVELDSREASTRPVLEVTP